LTAPHEVLELDTRHVGRRVLLFDELTSTNDVAHAAKPGDVIVADHQTAGRGQYARTWTARPGSSLLFSVVLDPPPELRRPVVLTAWAAVGVAAAIHRLTGVQAQIKWPNDLLLGGKKVCGILIEQRSCTVVGIGLNGNQSAADFTAAGLPDATSLSLSSGLVIDRNTALSAVLRQLDDLYDQLLSGNWASLEAEWKCRLGLIGRPVVAELSDGRSVSGRLHEMSFEEIELHAEGFGSTVLKPEMIRHLRTT
jgi:BirA family biotin operon repressor/biotin-[acetyl-CoA-carboxylase] ligase